MTTVKLKIKINNSYESEPSSGSGSSASEANEFEHSTCEEGIPNLPLMLNPGFYSMMNQAPSRSVEEVASPTIQAYSVSKDSSQESDFEGFSEAEIKNHRTSFIDVIENKSHSLSKDAARGGASSEHTKDKVSAGQKLFARFYDVLIEQNSCNAVDMQLSGENSVETPEHQKGLSEDLPSELSFNGKIKSLTSETAVAVEFGSQEQRSCRSSPKILKTILETTETSNYKYTNERSPDLFDDNDDDKINDDEEESMAYVSRKVSAPMEREIVAEEMNKSLNCPTESSFADENNENPTNDDANLLRKNIRREKELLKRIKTCLAGIPPPPSLTIPQLDMCSAIMKSKADILNFNNEVQSVGSIILCEEEGLFKPSHTVEEVKSMPWKEILGARQHGLCYNLCRASESIELLSLAVVERFIGAETSTSYTASFTSSPSSAKKRNLRLKMLTQSPGNRLSHLAKRRAIFSSANLATTSQKSSNSSLGGMQILLDKKKAKSRRKGTTPKRRTPGSKKKNVRKTPSSSARKRLFFRSENVKPGPSRETSKRALFQSPAKQQKLPVAAPKPTFKPEIANRVEKSKRALFSPDRCSQSSIVSSTAPAIVNECGSFSQASQSSLFGGNLDSLILKRKRTEDDISDITENSKKMFRHETETLTPRSLKIKSQSFCIGAGSTNAISSNINTLRSNSNISTTSIFASSSSNSVGRPITRAASDTTFSSSSHLTENHRKKLLWAVSQALQAKQINVTHSNFKQFASVLARVVRRLFQEYFQKSSSSTSETMLRLAKKHVYNVIAGKSADDIYLYAKSKIDEEKRMSSTRLSGYIAPDEYENRKIFISQTSLCSFENSMDSFSFSQTSSMCLTQPIQSSQNTEKISLENSNSKSAIKLPIQPNASLQNSSSKNNLGGIALRENVDCEQRRSAQKNFTGKDQRNVSPYVSTSGRSAKQSSSYGSSLYEMNSSTARAKRQISFDS